MDIKQLKPIPNYIMERITNFERKMYLINNASRFYSYLTTMDNDLVKITVAVKYDRSPELRFKQVAVHGLHSKTCFVRDMEYNSYLHMGYMVGWYAEHLSQNRPRFEDGKWYECEGNFYDPWAPCLNLDYLGRLKRFKYCGYKQFVGKDILHYLRIYEEYPQAEYLMKLGYHKLAVSKLILRKVAKDKTFRKWLINGKKRCDKFNRYSIQTILEYYKTGESMEAIEDFNYRSRDFSNEYGSTTLYALVKNDLKRFFAYIDKQKISYATYYDYFRACEHLGLDMTVDKNCYPHEFMRWHDIRIDQWNTARAEADRKAKEAMIQKFINVSAKYSPMQKENGRTFVTMIAKTPADLVVEGNTLHHCVGRMNYDQKFAREETLIFFIRQKSDMGTPFVTIEYSLLTHKILQCHGENNKIPEQPVLDYIYKTWLPFANKQLKNIAA